MVIHKYTYVYTMHLQQLRTFVEVHRRRSISEAARMLGLTQPAVSQHIASLEAQIGKSLFERHARGVRPTAVADDLAASLGDTLDTAEAALAGMRARSTRLSGIVHIAAPADYLAEAIAPRLAPLLAAGLELRLHTGGRDALYAMLLEDRTDLAITASHPDDARLAFAPLGTERLIALAAPELADRLSRSDDLATALGATSHITYDLDRPLVRTWLAANDLALPTRLPAVTVPDLRVLRALLCGGSGWSVLPNYMCEDHIRAGLLSEIVPPVARPENRFYLAWTRSALRQPRVVFARDALLTALCDGAKH